MSVTNRSGLLYKNAEGSYRDKWKQVRGRWDRHFAEAVVLEPPVEQALVDIALSGSKVKYEAPIRARLLGETVRIVDGAEVRGSQYLLTAVIRGTTSNAYDRDAAEAFDRAATKLDVLSSAADQGHDFSAVPRAYLGAGAVAMVVPRETAGVPAVAA